MVDVPADGGCGGYGGFDCIDSCLALPAPGGGGGGGGYVLYIGPGACWGGRWAVEGPAWTLAIGVPYHSSGSEKDGG